MPAAQQQTNQIEKGGFTQAQIDLISRTVAKGATPDELKLFLYQAHKTGLDPLARQIYFVKRGAQVTVQTSIDGFRLIAERSGMYAGQDEPQFEYLDPNKKNIPFKCTIRVYKFSPSGERYCAAVGVAFWDEYCPQKGQDFIWQKMPHVMLSKVCESTTLRKAFPQDLSGIYSTEEMSQADHNIVVEESNPPVNAQTKLTEQLKTAMNANKRPVEDEDINLHEKVDKILNEDTPSVQQETTQVVIDDSSVGFINEKQGKLIYALLSKVGVDTKDRAQLKSIIGYEHTSQIPWKEMSSVLENIKVLAEERGVTLNLPERK